MNNFITFLLQQAHRDDPIGGLAREASSDPSFQRCADTLEEIGTYLCRQGSSKETLDALSRAWVEYEEMLDPR